MKPIQTRTRRLDLLSCTILGVALLAVNGCGKNKVSGPRSESLERLAIDDFIDDDAQPAPKPEPEPGQAQAMTDTDPSPIITSGSGADRSADTPGGITLANNGNQPRPVVINDPPTDPSDPSGQNPASTPTRSLQLLDAKVGDVNGKPIFTSSFFGPIEDRLLAEADRLSINDWRGNAGRVIASRLDGIIADELLRAEALAALTPTQRVGLQAFLSNFRNTLLSENLGSSQLATRRILEREGMTLDEALKQKEVDTLVQLTLIREINRRVNVSWRDIRQRYERDIDEFSPPPSAVFRVIRAFNDDADTVEQINTRLQAGEDFVAIAADSSVNNYNPDQDGLLRKQLEGSFEETSFFGADVLNDPMRALQIGERDGPIEFGSSVYWFMLVDMEQESISLYDAQLKIQRDLTFERREEAKRQYFARLEERARVSTRDQVLMRLFEIAEQRYAPRR